MRDRFLDVEKSLSLASAAPTPPLSLRLTLRGLDAAPLGDQGIMVNTLTDQSYDSTSRVRQLE